MSLKQNTIFSSSALSLFGVTIAFYTIVYMVLIILPIYIHDQQVNYITIGWIMGITMLTSMIYRPLVGCRRGLIRLLATPLDGRTLLTDN
jgi:hypothetical protein